MPDQFDALIGPLIAVEGAYTNDPADRGGETNFGITVAVARENGYTGPMKAMTRDQAVAIYRSKFWIRSGFYLISAISQPVAAKLFDAGVNQGVGTVGMYLQRVLNVFNRQGVDYADIPVDGGIGAKTAAALQGFLTKRGTADGELVLLRALNDLQGASYIAIAEHDPTQEKYAFGWILNRIS